MTGRVDYAAIQAAWARIPIKEKPMNSMNDLEENTIWTYKDQQYVIIAVDVDGWSQDSKGHWVPTVIYRLPLDVSRVQHPKQFYRAYTDFLEKFRR